MGILGREISIINLGLEGFAESLEAQNASVIHVDWRPPAGGDPGKIKLLSSLERDEVDQANREGIERIMNSQPVLIDIQSALKAIPGMRGDTFLHSGPPVTWDRMCGPMRGAMIGAVLLEGLEDSPEGAERRLRSGDIAFEPCHEHSAVGPMAGVISPSMPVFVVKNKALGNYAFSNINEGFGKVLRFGAYGPEVIEKLRWIEGTLAPALAAGIREAGGIDLRNIMARALHMGDECHNRNVAATSIFARAFMPHLLRAGLSSGVMEEVAKYLSETDHFFLNLSMAACKTTMDSLVGLKGSSLVMAMTRNGTEFGIRVAGTGGEWFTAPAPFVKGLYFPGFKAEDANPDLGDSTITETAGIGGFAMAAAPAIVQFVGGSPHEAVDYTREMYEITVAKSANFTIPYLNFEGTPTGIDIRRVIATGIAPIINTGIAHREPGVGQIGAGLTRAPMECFEKALKRLAEEFG
ncbi:MAG: DUF1116 domain-containing protein [Candidatus Bathyarchaeia archaeon]